MSEEQQNTTVQEETFDKEDIEKNRVVSALAYIGILFFLPLAVCKDSKFGRFHANQGLVLFIFGFIGEFILRFIPVVGTILGGIYGVLMFVLFLYGLINTLEGNAKPLPVIGQIRIIK
jgi:uncharacterized membrane protein